MCRSSLFLGSLFDKNFRERTFVFGCWCWSCVFWWVSASVLLHFFGGSLPKVFGKILLTSGQLFFWVRSLFLWFFRRRRFSAVFLRDTDQVVTGHPHTRFFACSFSLFACFALFGRASCLGVPFWAPRVFGILLELTGLELARPF